MVCITHSWCVFPTWAFFKIWFVKNPEWGGDMNWLVKVDMCCSEARWNYNSFFSWMKVKWLPLSFKRVQTAVKKEMSDRTRSSGRGVGSVLQAGPCWPCDIRPVVWFKQAVGLWVLGRWTNTWSEYCYSDASCAASLILEYINSEAFIWKHDIHFICFCVIWRHTYSNSILSFPIREWNGLIIPGVLEKIRTRPSG